MNVNAELAHEAKHQFRGLPDIQFPSNVATEFSIELDKKYLHTAQKVAKALHYLRDSADYFRFLQTNSARPWLSKPKNYSAMMSLDFHLTPAGLKLIEINTNAAGSMIVYLLEKIHRTNNQIIPSNDYLAEIRNTFFSESSLALNRSDSISAAIVDIDPASQFFYSEFQLFEHLMKMWGWRASILDPNQIISPEEVDLIYNRMTDFYFSKNQNWLVQPGLCLTPHPYDYYTLADKSRLASFCELDLHSKFNLPLELQDALKQVLPKTIDLAKDQSGILESKAERKKYFFKPKNSFGGKATYRGESLSSKVVELIKSGDYVTQEYLPPSEMEVKLSSGKTEMFKYDLRFYFYQDRIQLVGARFFQGQVLNFRADGSGLAPVQIN